jgi:YfiH family protein
VHVLEHEPWRAVPGLRHGFLPGRVEPPCPVTLPRQVHGVRVLPADPDGERPEADGLFTTAANTSVGIVTADCVPMLMVAPRRRVVAAVHAGWRGAATGIVGTALTHLREQFDVEPRAVEVALGPAIGPCCYEVGPEVREAFRATSGETTAAAWQRRHDRDVLDLRRAVRALLEANGVERVTMIGPCTKCSPDFCSYRRDGADAGRQVSFIGWT